MTNGPLYIISDIKRDDGQILRFFHTPAYHSYPASCGSAPYNRIWNNTTLRSPKQQIWLRTALYAEDDVDVWRYAILELHARNDDDTCIRRPGALPIPIGGPRRNIAMTDDGATRQRQWRKFDDTMIRLDTKHKRDRRTGGQTQHDGIGRSMYSVARQNVPI